MKFAELDIHETLLEALQNNGIINPTPIQSGVIPSALSGKDIFGCSNTGTGKTAAFVIPVIDRLLKSDINHNIKALILCPTRELVQQISTFARSLSANTTIKIIEIYGGTDIDAQINEIESGCDIMIATPGRLCDLIRREKTDLTHVSEYILDECDRMLDMGFAEDIKFISESLPDNKQQMLFSATISADIESLINSYLNDPVKIDTSEKIALSDTFEQSAYYVEKPFKNMLLIELLKKNEFSSAIVFTKTRKSADELSTFLNESGIQTDRLHSDRSQNARESILKAFREGSLKLLIATDIASRGIDIEHISHVFNFELPQESETFIHRIGRTGRMGKNGIAITICEPKDKIKLIDIQKLMKCHIPVVENHTYASLSLRKAMKDIDDEIAGKSKKTYKGKKGNGDFFRRQKLAKKGK